MLTAILHNKLRPDEERMEDLLTAQVLGAASYLPPAACWVPLVASAQTLRGEPLDVPPMPEDVEVRFWPRWRHGDGRVTEPDVVLRWPGALVVLEAKYLSGKSSTTDEERRVVTDQLSRQLVLARREGAAEGRAWGVLYLTADPVCPRDSLKASIREVATKAGEDDTDRLAWASWTVIRDGFAAWQPSRPGDSRLARDLVGYLTRLGFGRFAGVRTHTPVPPPWRFSGSGLRWPATPLPPSWRFSTTRGAETT